MALWVWRSIALAVAALMLVVAWAALGCAVDPARTIVRIGLGISLAAFATAAVLDLAEHFRLERAASGRWWGWEAISFGETLVHGMLASLFIAFLSLARPLPTELALRDFLVLAAPLLFLALGGWDELVYHRRRSKHREDILHTTSHLASGASLAFVALDQVVLWS